MLNRQQHMCGVSNDSRICNDHITKSREQERAVRACTGGTLTSKQKPARRESEPHSKEERYSRGLDRGQEERARLALSSKGQCAPSQRNKQNRGWQELRGSTVQFRQDVLSACEGVWESILEYRLQVLAYCMKNTLHAE